MKSEELKVGTRVMVEGVVSSIDRDGVHIKIHDGELPIIGTFYFSYLNGIRMCPPTCSECGTDMEYCRLTSLTFGPTFRCTNCGATSGQS